MPQSGTAEGGPRAARGTLPLRGPGEEPEPSPELTRGVI
ncbi:hypothetical protein STRIP9103_00224 [Streptomyces ipomoeae 91-03]|uniref:Uncharacterized protein n=1 Tax=Streptomyces ipomoeae 91-03 TaxID=698759 RepID=L1KPR5_9ACTN|nr:hypothetical protein STRIP9103_00224 [Streptomyces ipomoeae 91-03]